MYCNDSVRRSISPVTLVLCGLLTAVLSLDGAVAEGEPPRAPVVTEAAEPPRTYNLPASADDAVAKEHEPNGKGRTEATKSDPGVDQNKRLSAAKNLQTWQLGGFDKTAIRLSQFVDGKGIIISVEPPGAVLQLTVRGITADDVSVLRADSLKLDPHAVSREWLRSGGAGQGAAKSRSSLEDPSVRETEIKLLENALQLAELEVAEKALLLEHGRAEYAQYQELVRKGHAPKTPAPSDPRLLEIELKKAKLRVERARIQLDAAK